jgi:hypothetical protein
MLDEYLKRSSEVSRRYRELEDDGVPSELDRRVLDSAREAVEKPRRWMRWSAPIALAASTVLVVSIVIETGVDKHAVPTSLPAESQSEAAAAKVDEPPAADVPLGGFESETAQKRSYVAPKEVEELSRARRAPVIPGESNPPVMVVPVQPAAPAAEAPPPEPSASAVAASPPPAPVLDESSAIIEESAVAAERADEAKREVQGNVRGEVRSRAPGISSEPTAVRQLAAPNPEVWLESIRQLRRDGKVLQANREWARFREVFPDYPVTDDDIARVPGPR